MAKSASVIQIDFTSYNFILSYLYKIYSNKIESNEIQVLEMLTIPASRNDLSMIANFYFNDNLQLYYTHANGVIVKISWHYNNFYLTFKLHNVERDRHTIIEVATIGYYQQYEDDDYNSDDYDYFALAKKIIFESFSFYKENCKSFLYKSVSKSFSLDDLQIFENFQLNNRQMFLSENLEHQTDKIKERIITSNFPQSILIFGDHGTGKSHLADEIISCSNCQLTALKVTGNRIDLMGLYSFVKVFDKILLVVDDIENLLSDKCKDLVEQFWEFIQIFESKENNKIFLIITTANRSLLEKASLQPNKINSIVKLKHFPKEYYKSLIERETDSKPLLNCFNEELLNKMGDMNLSAPFIINLVNHLKTEQELNNELNSLTAEKFLQMLYDSYNQSRE